MKILPIENIIKNDSGPYEWVATNMDPQFEIKGYENLLGKTVRLVLNIQADKRITFGPKIYWSTPEAPVSELNSQEFEPEEPNLYVLNFEFKNAINFLRLDPMGISCQFNIQEFSCDGNNLTFNDNKDVEIKNYAKFIEKFEQKISMDKFLVDEVMRWHHRPKISIVLPTYNTPLNFIKSAIDSVLNQLYANWELCIVDDSSTDIELINFLNDISKVDERIIFTSTAHNSHISAATNIGINIASSAYVGFLDHDDELHRLALYYVAQAINANPEVALIFTDEDFIGEYGGRYQPYFKCEFNYDLMLSHNMVTHFSVYSKNALVKAGLFRSEYDGAQDYDMALRVYDLFGKSSIIHVPRVLYHWRVHEFSSSSSLDAKPYAHQAAMRAIGSHLERIGVKALVEEAPDVIGCNRVKYLLPPTQPKVEIIILTRDSVGLLKKCIDSIINKTTYQNYSIRVIDNGSSDPLTFDYFRTIRSNQLISIQRDDVEFNFSALNNRAVNGSTADYVLLLNNDVEVISSNWMEEMLGLAIQDGVGCVGARLWYPDDTLQHGGLILGLGGIAGHSHKFLPKGEFGYANRAALIQSISGVTAACLLVERVKYLAAGGMDEEFKVAFNDVDFCLRILNLGYRNVWTPYAELYHHESATRGYEDTPVKKARFHEEAIRLRKLWGEVLDFDPSYSPNLTLGAEDFSLAWPPRV
ncbi:glycosyltransferase family 2 protein [Polynucleobacter paneuropaeus]|nr:glycosyltransferase family 2 protein [Polynucleobacter paneuropaeus]